MSQHEIDIAGKPGIIAKILELAAFCRLTSSKPMTHRLDQRRSRRAPSVLTRLGTLVETATLVVRMDKLEIYGRGK
jgi:hypothetical protein